MVPEPAFPIISKSHQNRSGNKHWNWKGGAPKSDYIRVHRWVKKQLGRASKCEKCGTPTAARYDWSNRSGEYKYDLSDWWQLCASCHSQYDGVWNKGRKGKQPNHNTSGLLPGGWNKGLSHKKPLTQKEFARLGGLARKNTLTKKRRSEIARMGGKAGGGNRHKNQQKKFVAE